MTNTLPFMESFKGKTVDEVIEILEKTEEQIKEEQTLFQQNKVEWYKSCIGKCFIIQHNDVAFSLVHIKEKGISKKDPCYYKDDPRNLFSWECYHIVLSSKIESNAGFNVLWLNNPFEGRTTMPCTTCKEITKDKFEEITSSFNSLIDKAKQILN